MHLVLVIEKLQLSTKLKNSKINTNDILPVKRLLKCMIPLQIGVQCHLYQGNHPQCPKGPC